MEKSPAFQWYPKDFLTDLNVVFMTLEQRGAYITLLSQCWLEGSLPMERTKLEAICNHPSNWEEIWGGIKGCFVENGSGQYINPRLEKERIKQEEWRTKSRRGGIISGKSRREKASKGGSQMVQTKKEPNANSSSSVFSLQSSSSITSSKRKKKRVRREYPAEFERLWGIHPTGGKIEAFKAMEKYDPDEAELNAWIEKLKAFKKCEAWTKEGGKYAPKLSKWINQGYFDGEIPREGESSEDFVKRTYPEEEWGDDPTA